jgi:PST family polysaccharide transporter
MVADPDTREGGIGARLQGGIAWKAASQGTLQVSRMVVALVVARLLAPQDWGVAAMVLVVANFATALTDNALGPALIQKPDLTEEDKSPVLWLNVALVLALAAMGTLLAGHLASFYGQPEVRPLFIAVSIGFLVSCLGTTHAALLQREMSFRQLELRQMVATIVGAVAGISIALAHFGAWAIVGQQLAVAATSTVLLWAFLRWRPRLTFSRASFRTLGGFAGFLFGENLLYQGGSNLGNLVIGRFLGAVALGTYGLAANVILSPVNKLVAPLSTVFFPAFVRMSHDRERLTDAWLRSTRVIAAVTMPALAGLAVLAPDFVHVVLGPRWSGAVTVIVILACGALVQSIDGMMGEVLLAVGRPRTLFWLTVVWFCATTISIVIGLHWGIVGVAVGFTVAAYLNEPIRMYIASKALGVPFPRVLRSMSGVAGAVILMVVVVFAARRVMEAAGLSAFWRLALLTLIGGAVYLVSLLHYSPEIGFEFRRVIERRRASALAQETATG